jgi:restriction system protein
MIQAMTSPTIPAYHEYSLPTLRAVDDLGGSGSISEIVDAVTKAQAYTEEQQAVLHKNGPDTEIGYRLAWARTHLKYFGLLSNSARGVWAITEEGTRFLHDPASTDEQRERRLQEFRAAHVKAAAIERAARTRQAPTNAADDLDASPEDDTGDWKERLIATLTAETFSPAAFERLAQRLLREADFESVIVTGRSGDQGIDGMGTYRLGLLTFPVFFQCKRYTKSVGPGEVRDFRGAMAGRGEKGLLITTGTFTAEAKKEANRDGATPIELIDGDKLCDLLQQYDLGVRTTQRVVEDVEVVAEFFQDM